MSDSKPPSVTKSDSNSYDWLTIMDGPELEGKECVWFGRYDEDRERINDNWEVETWAVVCEHVPLPRPMTRPEIEDWLETDDIGQEYIENFGLSEGSA